MMRRTSLVKAELLRCRQLMVLVGEYPATLEAGPVVVTRATVLRWQRRRFHCWTKLSGRPTVGRPPVNVDVLRD